MCQATIENCEIKTNPNQKMYQCVCGSVITFSNKSNHFKSKRHRRFVEDPDAETTLRFCNKQTLEPDTLSYCLNNKVANLTEEQKERRREYFRIKTKEFVERKKNK